MNETEDIGERQTSLKLETKDKWDNLSDDLRHKRVESVTFELHLPYLLEQPSPIQDLVQYRDHSLALDFSVATRDVTYSDRQKITEKYSKATVKLVWQNERKTLEQVLSRPLVELTEFPILVINGLIEAYQLLSGDHFNRQLNPLEISYISGTIKLVGKSEPLRTKTEHWRNREPFLNKQIEPDRWLYFSMGLLSGDPVWIARKTYNQATRADHVGDGHIVFIECVTCIEVLSDYLISRMSKEEGLSERHLRQRLHSGLRRVLAEEIPKYLKTDELDDYKKLVNNWVSKVYSTRNRIAHQGQKAVSKVESAEAIHLTGILAQRIENIIWVQLRP